jgi:hypothetical protein
MEGLDRLVSESFARRGFAPTFDHRRLQWSPWLHCADSLSLVRLTSRPGVFALGEEVVAPGEAARRMLALFRIREADDLGIALARLFLPGSEERERLVSGRCFIRYAVVEDAVQRHAAYAALQSWFAASAEAASGIGLSELIPAGLGSYREPGTGN